MAIVKVSKKGWIVIPKEIRDRHHIRPGDRVHVLSIGRRISIVPAVEGDPIERARGFLKGGPSLAEELIQERLEDLEREERDLPPPRPRR